MHATVFMVRFKTTFLLKATVVTAVCCLPMALNKESGFVWTAFFLPIALAGLAATEMEQRGPFEFKFQALPNSHVVISAEGGRQRLWHSRIRILLTGVCLSVVVGPPMLHLVDPGPIELWLPIAIIYAAFAVMLVGCSVRHRVLPQERQFVKEWLLFGRRFWRRRWLFRDGDVLAMLPLHQTQPTAYPELPNWHGLFVFRSERPRRFLFGRFARDEVDPDIVVAAGRVAELVDVAYEGYRDSNSVWWMRKSSAAIDGDHLLG